MKRSVVLCIFAAGVSAAGEWEEPEERERAEAFEEEREARHRVRMEAFRRALQKEISVEFGEESLGDVIEFISDAAVLNIAVHKEVKLDEKVTLKLTELPVHAVLEALARVCSLCLELEGGVVLFMPEGEERDKIGKLWLELGPFEMELQVYEDDVPPDLRRDLVRRALRMMHGMGERREGRFRPGHEEERRRRAREREEFEREHERREPEHERRERGEEF